ncbi:MAG TPA: Rne/Rng family ribonuclease [Verrucomicrobiae bacterium]|nr:Rne/Rng family ribonuclease [Verrucomicrobiae bacterium]
MKEILVQVEEEQTRVALMDEGRLAEVYIERSVNQRLVGNIYKGRVENVLPGMQAAFVNIGLEKNAFLYVGDAVPPRAMGEDGEVGPGDINLSIRDVLKEGQEVLVQIVKEPVGTKGARITTNITLPGRYLVLMPTTDYVGISRRIEGEEERERLKKLAAPLKPEGMGLIVRTVAENLQVEDFAQDVQALVNLWRKIQTKAHNHGAPAVIHKDLELVQRIVRDIFAEDVERMVVNSRFVYEKLQEAVDILAPGFKRRIILDEIPELFAGYPIEQEIQRALKKKVWLKSGGYLVIDQTEALTVVDVNTGKYVGSTNLASTVLDTNLEAALEIARQVRLRNIGGIIIIDFIDMTSPEHQAKVLEALEKECKKDKTKSNILGLTQLGLVEMTRKKVWQGLESVMTRSCPYCEGTGRVMSEETIGLRVRDELLREGSKSLAPGILVEANPLVASQLIGSGGHGLEELEKRTGKKLVVRGMDHLHMEEYSLSLLNTSAEIENASSPVEVGQVVELFVEEPHSVYPNSGISRLSGLVINVEDGGAYVGQRVMAEIVKVQRTSARARLIKRKL